MPRRFDPNEYSQPIYGMRGGMYPNPNHPDTTPNPNEINQGNPWKIGDPNLPEPKELKTRPWKDNGYPDEGGIKVPRKPKPKPSAPSRGMALELPREKSIYKAPAVKHIHKVGK